MAVGFDSATESSAWTTTPDPFTFTATPAGTATWALLLVCQAVDDTDDIDGTPTIGGVAMPRFAAPAVPTGEPARVYGFFLAGSWSSIQTISIPHTATSNTKIATLIYGTGTACGISNGQASIADAALAGTRAHRLATTTAGMRFVMGYTGAGAPANLTPLTGQATLSEHDFGNNAVKVDRENGTSTDFTIGFSETGEDTVSLAVAVEENITDPIPFLYRYVFTTAATAHLAVVPSPLASDDLLLLGFVAGNNGGTVSTPTDWTRFDAGGGNTTILPAAFWKESDGSETSVDVVTSAATNSNALLEILHIPAGLRDPTQDPEATTTGPTTSGTPDPNGLTPSWGSADTRWVLWLFRDGNDGVSALGSDYDFHFNYSIGTSTEAASSWFENTASSEDPPASTVGSTDEEFIAFLIGVLVAADSGVTGTGASTLDGVTSAGSGTFTPPAINGTGASTLDGVTSAGAGTYTPSAITGTGSTTLTGVTSSGAGTFISAITGTGASTLTGVVSAGSGSYTPAAVTGTGAATLDGVTSAGTGTTIDPITGTGSATLDGVTSTGTGQFASGANVENVICGVDFPAAVCAVESVSAECGVEAASATCKV